MNTPKTFFTTELGAKFGREDLPSPKDWVIIPENSGFRLVRIRHNPTPEELKIPSAVQGVMLALVFALMLFGEAITTAILS